jgi:hypothetical protein
MECFKELGRPSFEPIIADYYEGAIAIIECSRGHKSAFMLQSQKFEVLLESGANALIEGYTIEAAFCFSVALERFYEFCIRVFCMKDGLDEIKFKETFKQMEKQSERQLGAFLYLYLQHFKKAYKVKKEIVEFRNRVVHKGYIPTPEEVENYGENIFGEICNVAMLLKQNFPDEITKVVMADMRERGKNLPPKMPRTTTTGTMFFNLASGDQKVSFKEALASYKEAQEKLAGAVPYMKMLSKNLGMAKKATKTT